MLEQLQTTLSEVEEVQRAKQIALASLNAPALFASAHEEGRLVQSLFEHRDRRQLLLEINAPADSQHSILRSYRTITGRPTSVAPGDA